MCILYKFTIRFITFCLYFTDLYLNSILFITVAPSALREWRDYMIQSIYFKIAKRDFIYLFKYISLIFFFSLIFLIIFFNFLIIFFFNKTVL